MNHVPPLIQLENATTDAASALLVVTDMMSLLSLDKYTELIPSRYGQKVKATFLRKENAITFKVERVKTKLKQLK